MLSQKLLYLIYLLYKHTNSDKHFCGISYILIHTFVFMLNYSRSDIECANNFDFTLYICINIFTRMQLKKERKKEKGYVYKFSCERHIC